MRVLFVITRSCAGGAQSVVINLANSICHNNEVAVAAGIGDGEEAFKVWELLSKNIQVFKVRNLVRQISLFDDFKALLEIRKVYKAFKPDVIHLHSSKVGFLGRIILPSKKIIYTVHGFDTIRLSNRKLLFIERILQYRCRYIVGVSRYDYDNMRSEKINHNISVIFNGLSIPTIEGNKQLILFSNEKKNILSIARVSPPKRHDLFMQIASLLPEYNFIWIGNLTPIEGTPENCHFVGNIPNAGVYCRMADLFILVSDYEGLPMTIIEAMSQGKPIVSSDVGGVHEIVKNDVNGYVVPNEAAEFVEKIRYILNNDLVYSNMSKESLGIYTNSLTVDKMVSSYYKLYCEIANITS